MVMCSAVEERRCCFTDKNYRHFTVLDKEEGVIVRTSVRTISIG